MPSLPIASEEKDTKTVSRNNLRSFIQIFLENKITGFEITEN
jgi:hypothetical protein